MTSRFDAQLDSRSPLALGVFRIVVGLLFLLHGTSKLLGWPGGPQVPVGTWPFWYAGIIEVAVGVLVTIGLFLGLNISLNNTALVSMTLSLNQVIR